LVRLEFVIELEYEVLSPYCDFVFALQAAHTARQRVIREDLRLDPAIEAKQTQAADTGNRSLRASSATGPFKLRYAATVEVDAHLERPELVMEAPVAQLPAEVLTYVYPSRYCESDRLYRLANREFGSIPPGYARVQTIRDWVLDQASFTSNTSTATTSAVDVLINRAGVCRDFAHVMIALCRALNIPARFTTGIDYGADPALGPSDFHAYVEVYLSGRWYIFDPSGTAVPMGFVRLATGRDAADVAFATIFGSVRSQPPRIEIRALVEEGGGCVEPYHCDEAISTDP
jgi:transglutaminase-like putative cysteine protease